MIRGAPCLGRIENAAAVKACAVAHGETVQSGKGPRGMEAVARRVDIELFSQGLQASAAGPFIEIPRDDDRPFVPPKAIGQGGQLTAPVPPHQPKVHRRHDQGPAPCLDPRKQGPARLKPRQIDGLGPQQSGAGGQQDRITMPPEVRTRPDRHMSPARPCQQARRQGRGAQAQPLVGLLQRQDVGTDIVCHPEDPRGVPPPVQPNGLADIVAGQPDEPGRLRPRLRRRVIVGVWIAFALLAVTALVVDRPILAAVSTLALALTVAPLVLAARFQIVLPLPFVLALAGFLTASLLLGEAFDMYERIWWWDIALHTVAATGLGMAGFLFVLMLFEGARFAAPIWALTLIAACVAITLGVMWELFEFTMDHTFGLTMQKSGLNDTMGDLLADLIGATLGALTGTIYLTGRKFGFATALIVQFVRINGRYFRKRK